MISGEGESATRMCDKIMAVSYIYEQDGERGIKIRVLRQTAHLLYARGGGGCMGGKSVTTCGCHSSGDGLYRTYTG